MQSRRGVVNAAKRELYVAKVAFCSREPAQQLLHPASMALSIALLAAAAQALKPITRRALATAPFTLALPAKATFIERRGSPQFIERELRLPTLKRTLTLTQAFGAARGAAKDAPDAGDRTGTYGWPGGDSLAYYLARHPEEVRRKRVLELGCGTGADSA